MEKGLNTFPKLLLRNYQRYGAEKIAMRDKKFGIWNRYTWKDYYENAKYLCFGLMKLGLKCGDKVSIIGENHPQWYWAEIATQAAGGVAVGVFTDCTPPEVKFLVNHSDSKFVFAHDQEQVDKILEILPELPNIIKVIYWDSKGLWFYEEPILADINGVMEIGRKYEKEYPISFEEIVENGKGEDIAFILYSSGTTGLPKGAMLSHNSYIKAVESINQVNPVTEEDDYLSFIPPAWSAEQAGGFVLQLVSGMKVNFAEKPETVRKDLREIAPQIVSYSPRMWEGMCADIQARMNDAKGVKRLAYRIALYIGYRKEKYMSEKKRIPILLRVLYFISDYVVFHGIKDEFGWVRARIAYTGGALISPDILKFFSVMGVRIRNTYGLTEFPYIAVHRQNDLKSKTCGPLLPHWEKIKIDDDGSILVKGNCVFKGYYKDPDKTVEMFREGWCITGDAGQIDEDGHLVVYGRLSDLRQLKGGNKFSPDYMETQLRFSPYIKDCIVIGGAQRDYVSALININFQNVGNWAKARHIEFTTFSDLSQKSQVYDLIQKEIESLNNLLPERSRIGKFVLLHKEFDPDEAELTRTRKLRRDFVEKSYSEIIEAIYMDKKEFTIKTEIIYQDGTKGVSKNSIKIKEILKNGKAI